MPREHTGIQQIPREDNLGTQASGFDPCCLELVREVLAISLWDA